jgi:hypothetical protein
MATSPDRRSYATIPIDASAEKGVIETLQRTVPCSSDDLVMQLPDLNWNVVFVAAARMSRDGRLLLRRLARSAYQISLPSRYVSPRLSSPQQEVQS